MVSWIATLLPCQIHFLEAESPSYIALYGLEYEAQVDEATVESYFCTTPPSQASVCPCM